MLKRSIRHLFHVGGVFIILTFVSGCSLLRGPVYPDIIYNDRQPLISVTYEYGEIELRLPLNYTGAVPDNILFEVYAQGDTSNPIITILQEAPRVFFAYLPQGVLDINNKSNMIKIIPQDDNFDPVKIRFQGIRFGRIQLPPKSIRMGQLIVSGKVFLNRNNKRLAGVNVSMQNYDNVIKEIVTNDSGFYQIAVPGEYKYAKHLRLVVGENLIFKPYKQLLDFSQSRKKRLDVGVGPSAELEDPLYLINRENVHFREYPDIGSKTLFLLEKGEIISVGRVTPGEYYGSIEVEIGQKKNVQMDGWVYRSDVTLLDLNNIYKDAKNEDTTL
ncbi:MAG: hypothetical protein CMG57_05890 [Candidatus Marinimicrobia bacterium]|nr:hypothetical protein [Candidatus Neomarinimicrobiota bacterium]